MGKKEVVCSLFVVFSLLAVGFSIGFAPSSKQVQVSGNTGLDYFTFSNPEGVAYTCSMSVNDSRVSVVYSPSNPFTTSAISKQIIATYTVPTGFVPSTMKMTLVCSKGSGGTQSIINQFSRTLSFVPSPITTTTIRPVTTTSIKPVTTTTVAVTPIVSTTVKPSTTTTSIKPKLTTTTIKPFMTTTLRQFPQILPPDLIRPTTTTKTAPIANKTSIPTGKFSQIVLDPKAMGVGLLLLIAIIFGFASFSRF